MKIEFTIIVFLLGINCFGQNCFKIGDSKLDVKLVQGVPYSTDERSNNREIWVYGIGGSTLEFENGRLLSYRNSTSNLKICEIEIDPSKCYKIGDSKLDVRLAQGNPYAITIRDNKEIWEHEIGGSTLNFEDGRLLSYRNSTSNLKICEIEIDPSKCYKIGDSKLNVKLVQGNPYAITVRGNKEIWEHEIGGSILEFEDGKLISYRNSTSNLKICEIDQLTKKLNSYSSKQSNSIENFQEEDIVKIVKENEFIIHFPYGYLEYNNHVGNEWFYFVEINGQKLYKGEKIIVLIKSSDSIKITCYVQETEEKYNDWAEESYFLTQTELNEYRNNGFYIPVIITESNGRYTGNSAQMNFYFDIK